MKCNCAPYQPCKVCGKYMPLTKNENIIIKYLKLGDTITHTRCMGCIEEHIYTGREGRWICGKPTKDTIRLGGSKFPANDISPKNVTHINRTPLEAVEFLAEVI